MKSKQASPASQQPPQPPPFQRRIRLEGPQKIGVPLLALIPLAALFGAFGLRADEARAVGDGVTLQVRYPALLRRTTALPFELTVVNSGSQPLSGVSARVDRSWLSHFSGTELTPQPDRLTERHAEITIGELAPGAQRKVVGMLQGGDYGRHAGQLSIAVGGRVVTEAPLRTMVLP
jgi:multidrug efflux pump subunit AcrA (membrane-fusion protein)